MGNHATHANWSPLVQVRASFLCDVKSQPEPILTYCQMDPGEQNFNEFWVKTRRYLLKQMHSKMSCKLVAVLRARQLENEMFLKF